MSDPVPSISRVIVGVQREGADAVVLRLDCGHRRHVRHRPPLSSHAWVGSDAECEQRVGQRIECLRCGQRELPPQAQAYRSTAEFDEHTLPAGLQRAHTTKAGAWGRVVVEQGTLWLCFEPPLRTEVLVRPGQPGVIPPQLPHHIRLAGPVRLRVEFLAVADLDG